LAAVVAQVLPGWVEGCVARFGVAFDPAVGDEAAVWVVSQLRHLGGRTPLQVLREAVRFPTSVLRAAGMAPVDRDEFSVSRFPDDDYDLTPANWADVDPSLVDPGVRWMAERVVAHRTAHGAGSAGGAGGA
jgi:hypothetical protein